MFLVLVSLLRCVMHWWWCLTCAFLMMQSEWRNESIKLSIYNYFWVANYVICIYLQVWTPIWDSTAYSKYRDEHCNACNDTAVCKCSTEIRVAYKTAQFYWSVYVIAFFMLLINQHWFSVLCFVISTDVCWTSDFVECFEFRGCLVSEEWLVSME